MDKKHGLSSLALIVVVASALFRPAADRLAATQGNAGAGHDSGHEQRPSATRPDDDDQADTLDVIADSLGVDISSEGLIRRAKRSLNALSQETGDTTVVANAREYLQTFLSLDIRKDAPGLAEARAAALQPTPEVKPLQEFFDQYFNRDALHVEHPSAQEKLLAEDFNGVDKTALKLAIIRQTASGEKTLIRFLIATLPDPIDSFTGWLFDPMLVAITLAISECVVLLDRFYFPDVRRTSESAAETGLIHEDEPSLVIFRSHLEDSVGEAPPRERLVLLLVHENPSAGVHDRALARAIRLVARWDGPGSEDIVRILGPTFSGSSESMARAIRHSRSALAERGKKIKKIWIVSGSATDPQNKTTLQAALDGALDRAVTFQATVQDDNVLLRTLMQHVTALGWSTPIAVLSEGNTQYGREMGELADKYSSSPTIRLTYPINISRLRTIPQAEKSSLPGALGLPSRFHPLAMEQDRTAEDQIPQFSPKTTLSYMELQLADLLRTLRREHVGTVALMGTDPRDKLYLAQQIAHDSPDVSIITAESDAFYGHPDYSSQLQGALVASTYPLFAGSQRWNVESSGNSQRRQFANGASEGIYNATLALLNYKQDGTPRSTGQANVKSPPRLIEYTQPLERREADGVCAKGCQPPVWISVIGRSGAWPSRAYAAPANTEYVFPILAAGARKYPLTTFPSRLFTVTCIALVLLAAVMWWRAHVDPATVVEPLKGHGFIVLGVLSVFVVNAFVTAILFARFRLEGRVWTTLALAAGVASLALLADLARRALARERPSGTAAAIGAIGALWLIGNLVLYLRPLFISGSFAGQPANDRIGFVMRAINFGSGVNPLLPVLFLMAAVALWTIVELKRARTPGAALTDPSIRPIIARTINGSIDDSTPRWAFFDRSIVAVPMPFVAAVGIAIAAVCVSIFDPIVAPLVTSEGPAFGRLVSTGFLIAEALVALSILQFVYLWWALKQLLEQMAWYPSGDAYQRVPPELFPPSVFPKIPRLMELQMVVARCRQGVTPGVQDIDLVFQEEMRTAPGQHWSTSRTWKRVVTALAPSTDLAFASVGITNLAITVPAHPDEQELMAISMALVIRDAIARLGHNLFFILGGMLLVFCAHTVFPFQLHTQLAAVDWAGIGLAFGAIIVVIVQMKRNELIGRISSAHGAERTTWDAEFVLKLVVFCLIPLLTLFATQFPDLGATVLGWLEPVEKALP